MDIAAMAEDGIKIHQSLHGYKSGHKLLSTSADLGDDERRFMLALSDYSGSGIEPGFESYLTGYPLPSSKYFVFAKTWYANEMSRPGCVWTHSLLVEFTDLWSIRDMEGLLSLFKRPTGEQQDPSVYSRTISFKQTPSKKSDRGDLDLFFQLSCEFYSTVDKSLVILSESSESLEKEILRLWSWQWPRMKRAFTFSTGSLGMRKYNGENFHLQIVPTKRQRSIDGNSGFKIIEASELSCQSPWLKFYAQLDLVDLQKFMVKYGSDVLAGKATFLGLLNAYQLIVTENLGVTTLERFVISNFPEPDDAKLLKTFFIESLSNNPNVDKSEILRLVLHNESLKNIDWTYWRMIGAFWGAGQLPQQEFTKAIKALVERNDYSLLREVFYMIPANVWCEIPLLEDWYIDLLDHDDALEKESAFWKAPKEVRNVFFSALMKREKTSWSRVVRAMLDADSEEYFDEISSLKSKEALKGIVDWILSANKLPSSKWEMLLRQQQEFFFESIGTLQTLNNSLIKLAAKIITPSLKFWKRFGPQYFENLVSMISGSKQEPEATGLYLSLLTMCYEDNVSNPLFISNLVFQPLHDRMGANHLEVNSWERFRWIVGRDIYGLIEQNFVSKIFNDRNHIPDWDRCEFLRRALLVMFLKHRWNPINLTLSIKEKDTFEKLVEFGIQINEGRTMLSELYKRLKSANVNSFYFKILKREL